jgi:hypothetical protein
MLFFAMVLGVIVAVLMAAQALMFGIRRLFPRWSARITGLLSSLLAGAIVAAMPVVYFMVAHGGPSSDDCIDCEGMFIVAVLFTIWLGVSIGTIFSMPFAIHWARRRGAL